MASNLAVIDPTGQWEMIAISTLEYYVNSGKLHDQVFVKTPLLDWVNTNDVIDRTQCGSQIVCNLETDKNDSFKFYAGYGTLPCKPQKGADQARYDWTEWATCISICGREKALNRGECELFDLLTQKVENAVKSTREEINRVLINGDGSLSPDGYPTMLGIETLIGDHLSAQTVVGGIDATKCEWWRSKVIRPNDPDYVDLTTPDNKLTLSMRIIDNMFDCLEQECMSGKPDMVLTTKRLLRDVICLLKQENQTILYDEGLTLRTGCDNVVYRGVPFMSDKWVPEGRMYFISRDGIKLHVMPDVWFSQTAWQKPYDQNAMYAHILGMGQFTTCERRCLGKVEDLVPACTP